MEKGTKRTDRRMWVLWLVAAAVMAGGMLLLVEHIGTGAAPATEAFGLAAAPALATSSAAGAATRTFSEDGYAFTVPGAWTVERTGTDTIAVHADAAPDGTACKIEVSAFPFPSGADTADWIAHRIGADPSLVVAEQSSEDVSFDGGTGVKWTGTIDGIPTTLVYAFTAAHAYEIVPSATGGPGAGTPAQCGDAFQAFLSGLTF